jgi:hypothetical protein
MTAKREKVLTKHLVYSACVHGASSYSSIQSSIGANTFRGEVRSAGRLRNLQSEARQLY